GQESHPERQAGAVPAARAPASDHGGLLLLPGRAGDLAIVPAPGRVRALDRVRRLRELFRAAEAARVLPRHGDDRSLLGAGRRALPLDRALARGDGRQEPEGGRGLQDAADLALRGRAGGRRRAVGVHLPPLARHVGAPAADDGGRLEPPAQRPARHGARDALGHLETGVVLLPVLPRRPAEHPAQRHRSGRDRRRAPLSPVLDHHLPAALADDVLPHRRDRGLRVLRHLRHHRRRDRWGPGRGHDDARLQGLRRRTARRRPRRLGGAVRHPHGHRDRADGDPVPLHRATGPVL
ncbi:MAG: Glycerol-3-phosphate ABC transporter, permease protein UgpA, partial [uncultured Microvirga sp.]